MVPQPKLPYKYAKMVWTISVGQTLLSFYNKISPQVGIWFQNVESTREKGSFDLIDDIFGNCTIEGLFDIIDIKNETELKAKDLSNFLKKTGLMRGGKAKKTLKKGVKNYIKEVLL